MKFAGIDDVQVGDEYQNIFGTVGVVEYIGQNIYGDVHMIVNLDGKLINGCESDWIERFHRKSWWPSEIGSRFPNI